MHIYLADQVGFEPTYPRIKSSGRPNPVTGPLREYQDLRTFMDQYLDTFLVLVAGTAPATKRLSGAFVAISNSLTLN